MAPNLRRFLATLVSGVVILSTAMLGTAAADDADPAASPRGKAALSATPGGPPAEIAPRPIESGSATTSTTRADCTALIERVRAGLDTSHPDTCVSARILDKAPEGMDVQRLAADLPEECGSFSVPSAQWWVYDRREACNHTLFEIIVTEVPSGKILGTATMHAINTATAGTNPARVTATTRVWVWAATGIGSPTSSTGTLFGCPGDCLGNGNTYTHPSFDEWRGAGSYDVYGLAPGEIIRADGKWELTFSGRGWSNSVNVLLNVVGPRCDDAIGNRQPGCVYEIFPSAVGFSETTNPVFVAHVYTAQLSGLPGRLNSGTYLTRLTDQTLINRNGSRACPTDGSLPRPDGMQCDEYPFRSTHEGAYTAGGDARSFDGCQMPDPARTGPTGFSRCFIPASQNMSAGALLGAFYSNERMLDGDPFQVGYLP